MDIFWVELSNITYKEFLKDIIKLKKRHLVFTPNPEMLLSALKDKKFLKTLKKADYLLPDWIGTYIALQIRDSDSFLNFHLLWKWWLFYVLHVCLDIIFLPYYFFNLLFRKKHLYKKYWERVPWSDLTDMLLCIFESRKEKITVIDLYNPRDIKKLAYQKVFVEKVKESYPWLKMDYFVYEESKKDEIIKKIDKSKSHVLFSTLWMKLQEESVIEIMDKCKWIKLWLWVWSSFDYITWFQNRAPKIFKTIWIEWLYRLITGPQKLKRIKRIWNAIFVFTWNAIKEK